MAEVEAVKSKDDIATVNTLLKKHAGQDYSDIWKTGLNTAFRASDLLSIRFDHIDLDRCEITLIESKTKKSRTVRLNDTVIEIINRRRLAYPNDTYLFQSHSNRGRTAGRPLTRVSVSRKFREVGEIIGVRLNTHSMRKTRGYAMHQAGISIERICRVLNHSSPAVTMAYIGLTKEDTLKTYTEFEL